MTQVDLFEVQESLSSEAAWLKRYHIIVTRVTADVVGESVMDWLMEPSANWFAFRPPRELSASAVALLPANSHPALMQWITLFFAELESPQTVGNGFTRDEAIADLCRSQGWPGPLEARYGKD